MWCKLKAGTSTFSISAKRQNEKAAAGNLSGMKTPDLPTHVQVNFLIFWNKESYYYPKQVKKRKNSPNWDYVITTEHIVDFQRKMENTQMWSIPREIWWFLMPCLYDSPDKTVTSYTFKKWACDLEVVKRASGPTGRVKKEWSALGRKLKMKLISEETQESLLILSLTHCETLDRSFVLSRPWRNNSEDTLKKKKINGCNWLLISQEKMPIRAFIFLQEKQNKNRWLFCKDPLRPGKKKALLIS